MAIGCQNEFGEKMSKGRGNRFYLIGIGYLDFAFCVRSADIYQIVTFVLLVVWGSSFLNANEEALLPFLRLHMRSLDNRIRAANPDPLHRRRTPQTQNILDIPFLPRRLQCVADSEEDRRAHKQWRLTHTP